MSPRQKQKQANICGVTVPADPYLENVTAPDTLLETAETGVVAEALNVAMYSNLLAKVKSYPSPVTVLTDLSAALLNNHLPTFEAAVVNGCLLP